MYGGCNIMQNYFSINIDNSYIDRLINQTFSILPIYEEHGNCEYYENKVNNLFYKMNGFFKLKSFHSDTTTDILSLLNTLKFSNNHKEVRSCVLKICSLLTKLKDGE